MEKYCHLLLLFRQSMNIYAFINLIFIIWCSFIIHEFDKIMKLFELIAISDRYNEQKCILPLTKIRMIVKKDSKTRYVTRISQEIH